MRDNNFTANIFKHVSAINIRILSLISLLPLTLLALVCSQATAAVQMGGHLDFVLKNGTTVRVFPEAPKTKTLRPKRVRNRKVKGNLKPQGGDPCKKLADKYKARTTKKKAKKKQAIKPPSYVKPTKGLKAVGNFSRFLRKNKPTGWYYIPMEPRLSYKAGKPEATFMKFITDEAEGKNSAEGGIFHLMVTYGLTKKEEKELRGLLEKAVPGAKLKGAVDLQPAKSGDNFIVTSGILSDDGFAPKGVLSSGRAPSMVGGKAAVAGRLSGLGAQLMEATFKNSTADMSVTFAYDYIVKTPAFRGQVLIHLDKIQETANCNLRTQNKQTKDKWKFKINPFFWSLKKTTEVTRISREDLEESYNTLLSVGAVEIKIDQELPDADVSAIEASLMQMAMSSFTNMQKSFMSDKEFQRPDKKAKKKDPKAKNWEVFKMSRKRTKMSGTITLNIEKGVALYRTHSMTGNMGIPMRKHRKQIFSEVLLNDPFFKRGKITVDLDMEALDLFEGKMVNNASVKVIVPFKKRPFIDDDVFTRASIEKGEIVKEFSFATRGDNLVNSDCPFRYLESWSLKGGGIWPKNQKEKCSREMVVTLVPPIKTRRIDVEADLDEMQRTGIRGADILLRYTLYGKEKVDTVRFRAAKPEPYIEQTIYVDKDASDVEYKVILTHAKEGKLPHSEWTKLEDNFIYTSLSELPVSYLEEIKTKIPEVKEIVEEVKEIIEEAKEPTE